MTATLNALYYVNAWEADTDVADGLAHRAMLKKCRLDYSVASLSRIDAFLDALRITYKPARDAFLDHPENQNLLYFLAFYVGEVVGRALGAPPLWLSYEDATKIAPDHDQMFSACFETSVCCRYPDDLTAKVDFFMPLYALFTRLLSADSGKSIRFSAGLFLPLGSDASPSATTPTPAFVPGLFGSARSGYSPPDAAARRQHRLVRPWWGNGHKMSILLDSADRLMNTGRLVWGTLVQANKILFEPEYQIGAGGEVIYDPSGRLPPEELVALASQLFALKGTAQRNAGLAALSAHLADEMTPAFGMDIPPPLCPQPLKLSSTYFDQFFLPDGMLTLRHFPLLISDDLPGLVMILPWQLWPVDLAGQWRAASESIHGRRIDSSDWKKRYDDAVQREHTRRTAASNADAAIQLYEEGLLHYHGRGIPQDFVQARHLWERAAELADTNSLNNLGILYEAGQGVTPDLQKSISFYRRAAEGGSLLAQFNMGKTYLRERDSGITHAEAKQWLQMAARQGNEEAVNLLLRHFR